MGKVYRTAQGKSVDMDNLRLKNENTPALGNMNVNARGDQLGPGGKVIRPREEAINAHYRIDNPNGKRAQNRNTTDDIPTSGGKAKSVEQYEPAKIRSDDTVVNTTESEDQIINESAVPDEPVLSDEPATVDKETGLAAGEEEIKGGLAKAIAKTRDYNEKRGKRGPKRL